MLLVRWPPEWREASDHRGACSRGPRPSPTRPRKAVGAPLAEASGAVAQSCGGWARGTPPRPAEKHPGQRPERDAERTQGQGAFDVRGACGHGGHQEGRPDAIAIGGSVLQAEPPDRDALLGRDAVAHELESFKIPREQFRHASEPIPDRAPELDGVVDDLPRGFFRDGQTNGTMPTRRPGRDCFGHDPPPFGHCVDHGRFVSSCQHGTAPPYKIRDGWEISTRE